MEDNDFYERVKKIETIKGLQLITIVTILSETNGFAQFNNIRQVVSYAGLDVAERQSGLFKGKTRISKKGQLPHSPMPVYARFIGNKS